MSYSDYEEDFGDKEKTKSMKAIEREPPASKKTQKTTVVSVKTTLVMAADLKITPPVMAMEMEITPPVMATTPPVMAMEKVARALTDTTVKMILIKMARAKKARKTGAKVRKMASTTANLAVILVVSMATTITVAGKITIGAKTTTGFQTTTRGGSVSTPAAKPAAALVSVKAQPRLTALLGAIR